MQPRTLIYIASSIGFLALTFGGWILYTSLVPGSTPGTPSVSGLQQFIFGSSAPASPGPAEEPAIREEELDMKLKFSQIVPEPVSGYLLYANDKGEPSVVYMERGTGFVYSIDLESGARVRLANTTIPRAVEALFLSTSTVAVRYEKGEAVETLLATIRPRGVGEGSLSGTLLPENLTSVAVNPDSQSVFYIREEGGSARGYVVRPGKAAVAVFSSPLREWNASFLSRDKVLLATKSSALASGRVLLLDLARGTEETLVRGLPGLSALSDKTASKLLYSASAANAFQSAVLDTKKATSTGLSLDTLSEKCVWGGVILYCAIPLAPGAGTYPDDWYMSTVRFSDDFWKVDTSTGRYALAGSPRQEAGQSIDAVSLQTDSDGRYLLFINKTDLSLWSLRLPNN